MKSIQLFVRLSRLIYIFIDSLLYLLGAGIAHYLSGQIDWTIFSLGFLWLVFLLLGFRYLNEYFDINPAPEDPAWWSTPFSGTSGAIGANKLPRPLAAWAGLTCLTVSASLTVLLFQLHVLNSTALVLVGILIFGEMAFSMPPLRLAGSGYGEVITSIIRVGIIPALAFTFQHGALHRLIAMVVFPLVILHLGMLLALEIPTYASDIKYGRKSIIVRIGWQKGMLLHNVLELGSFVLFGLAFVLGLPFNVGWSVFFILPISVFQVWMMNRIADGAKPNWNQLALVAIASFAVATYLLTFAFWTH